MTHTLWRNGELLGELVVPFNVLSPGAVAGMLRPTPAFTDIARLMQVRHVWADGPRVYCHYPTGEEVAGPVELQPMAPEQAFGLPKAQQFELRDGEDNPMPTSLISIDVIDIPSATGEFPDACRAAGLSGNGWRLFAKFADTQSEVSVRAVTAADAAAIARIYNYYVTDTIVTFEEDPVTADEMASRIRDIESASLPWFVAEQNGEVVGYAYAGKWKARRGYRIAVEVTVYLDSASGGKGIGSALYFQLISKLKSIGIHTAMGGIALPNDASIKLHEKFGFTKVAHFKENGIKFGTLIDVAYWQLML